MKRNLIVCCDGTANDCGAIKTNVAHLAVRLQKDENQRVHYEPGVGTFPAPGRWGERVGITLGKLFGYGIAQNIEHGYRFLLEHYQPGDRVFLFGFSRGAYAVRCLSGMLNKCGLLRRDAEGLVAEATQLYLTKGNDAEAATYKSLYSRPCPVHFLGVWDTVESLGYLYSRKWFFNAKLSDEVSHGFHALAIDERRPKFEPLPWDETLKNDQQTIEQVWFAGAHSDVGGGYPNRGLAEISLQWMLTHAQVHGLRIRADAEIEQPPNPAGTLHDSLNTVSGRMLKWLHLGPRPRHVPEHSLVHRSVKQRMARYSQYQPDALPERYITVPRHTATEPLSASLGTQSSTEKTGKTESTEATEPEQATASRAS
ncbi:DUF2235 domain-containing protein [Litchfieldella xinjiangensis]|uniref:DUF2235 domain-containing protein n=1 Tax=Litchfieldella xinjiangensis TaxID=1166948 RepID=UPI0009DEE0B9|nr:DUF2235 domain-containing protein [Halomonas xinjiangensis]